MMNDYLKKLETVYCTRDCANYKCRRNENHDITTDYAFYGDFKSCTGYIKPIEGKDIKE